MSVPWMTIEDMSTVADPIVCPAAQVWPRDGAEPSDEELVTAIQVMDEAQPRQSNTDPGRVALPR